jgi:ketosteroid isomerase-like protein
MSETEGQAADAAAIRASIDRFVAAIRAKDIDGVMSIFAADVVSYDLAPPLQHGGGEVFKEHWRALFGAYEGAIDYEIRDLHIGVSNDVAFTYSLNRTAGLLKSGQRSERWLRWTACFRKRGRDWLVVHEHVSVPVDLKNDRAVVDLKP